MKTLLIILLSAVTANAQLQSFVVKGDTVFSHNPSTGEMIQMNKVAASVTSQSIITALGFTPPSANRYSINVMGLTSSPVDATTYYFGVLPKAPVTVAGTSKIYIRKSGTIKVAELYCYSGTAGTAEAWTMYIRLNNQTDTQIASLSVATNERVFTNTNLSLPVVAGDYIEIKTVCPIWATNPLTVILGGYILIE